MTVEQHALHGQSLYGAMAKHVAARAEFAGSTGMPAATRLALRAELEKARTAEAAARRGPIEAGWTAGKFHDMPDLELAVQVHLAGLLADARSGDLAQVT
ncbi:hypothetical protein [Ralstonia mannitolilytica]|uniref:hypothetical protein n=1 Tax=Ralstonia mannitolilytica TaxID=105219 RepID=UPI00292FE551|nr:hypothetical protein [Ralstonia mannitolilytica]